MNNKLIENPFFKLVTPVYNSGDYLDKCIKSVLSQTFKDWVWLFIDDLSTDSSYEKLLEYEKQYPEHIKVFRVERKSYAGRARNYVFDYPINNQYTFCIDSDDWLADDNVFQRVYDCIQKNNNPDIIISPFRRLSNNKEYIFNFNSINDLLESKIESYSWQFFVKKEIDSKFAEYFLIEDNYWFLNLCSKIKSFACMQSVNYIYNDISDTSITNNKNIIANNNSLVSLSYLNFVLDAMSLDYSYNEALEKRKQFHVNAFNYRIKPLFNISRFKYVNYDELVKNSYMITVDDERYNLTCKVFDKILGWCPNRFQGVKDPNKSFPENCKASHIEVLKYARAHDLPCVMIFEDDAYPCVDCFKKLQLYTKYVPADADYIMLGYSKDSFYEPPFSTIQNFNFPFNKIIGELHGSHAYIVFKNIYDMCINSLINNNFAIDQTLSSPKFIKNNYVIDESIFIQFNFKRSEGGCRPGYTYYDHNVKRQIQNPACPKGFIPIEKIINK